MNTEASQSITEDAVGPIVNEVLVGALHSGTMAKAMSEADLDDEQAESLIVCFNRSKQTHILACLMLFPHRTVHQLLDEDILTLDEVKDYMQFLSDACADKGQTTSTVFDGVVEANDDAIKALVVIGVNLFNLNIGNIYDLTETIQYYKENDIPIDVNFDEPSTRLYNVVKAFFSKLARLERDGDMKEAQRVALGLFQISETQAYINIIGNVSLDVEDTILGNASQRPKSKPHWNESQLGLKGNPDQHKPSEIGTVKEIAEKTGWSKGHIRKLKRDNALEEAYREWESQQNV